jgi:O-antigen ligase
MMRRAPGRSPAERKRPDAAAALLAVLVCSSALAFGAVYSWGLVPLLVVATLTGLVGLVRAGGRVPPRLRGLAMALAAAWVALACQLLPLSSSELAEVSPNAPRLLAAFNLAFVGGGRFPLSVNPAATTTAVLAFGAFAIYLIGAPLLMSRKTLRELPGLIIVLALPLALVGILSTRLTANGLVFGFWKPVEGSGRNAFGPFVNRNHFAGWMVMAVSLGLGYWCGCLERARRRSPIGSARDLALWLSAREGSTLALAALAIATLAASLVWTMSRSGIFSFGIAVGCFSWLVARRPGVPGSWRVAWVGALVLLFLAGVSWRGVDRLASRYGEVGDVESRFGAWHDAWQVVHDFPLVGTGLNTFDTAMLFYQHSNRPYHLGSAHNDYLQLLAEGGLLLAAPAGIALVVLTTAIRRNLHDARRESRGYWIRSGASIGLIGIAVQEVVDFSLQIPANAFLFCTLAAVALAPVESHDE